MIRPVRPMAAPAGLLAGLLASAVALTACGTGNVSDRAREDVVSSAADPTDPTDPAERRSRPRLLVTSAVDGDVRLSRRAPASGSVEDDAGLLDTVEVVVDTDDVRQRWWGAGAALTDGSVGHLRRQDALTDLLFDPQDTRGARLRWVRLPLSATDMSVRPWTWRWDGERARPTRRAKAAVRVLRREVLARQPDLKVVASPWTAPPAMKEPAHWFGGTLREDKVAEYADMLVSQARLLLRRGVPLRAMTLANEPGHAADYPTMEVSDAQLARLARLAGPRLQRLGVEVWGLDHNWEDRARFGLAAGFDDLDAVAFHCYEGTPAQARGLPVPWVVSECTGTDDNAISTFAWDTRVLLSEAVDAGSHGLLMWNLVLSPGWAGAFGGCGNCRGLLTHQAGTWWAEPEYYVLAHLARAAPPGSRVLGSRSGADLPVAAFTKRDRVGVVGYNDTDRDRLLRLVTADGEVLGSYELPAWSLFTFRSR